MSRLFGFLCVFCLSLAAGCAHSPYYSLPVAGSEPALQDWVADELAPELARQLGEHPRFKGEPVILVKLEGPDVQPDIDGLTRSIREQLLDTLLRTPGVRLPWQPQHRQEQHHRRLDQVNCARIRDAHYFVGIEISPTANAQFRVSVRALDVRAGEWVSGLGKSWQGRLTPGEQRALQERRTDESLRGLRVLPFSSGQPDLAAAYLANNLSCLLRQQDEEDLVVYVEALKSEQAELRTLLELIGNNLSRYREVRVSDAKGEANFVLRGEAHKIQSGLYQVWVVLRPRRSDEHLAGMDTATYIRITAADPHPARRAVAHRQPAGRPVIPALDLEEPQRGSSAREACRDQPGSDGCQVLKVTAAEADGVFVFAHSADDGLIRVSPGTCRRGTELAGPAVIRRAFVFPGVFPGPRSSAFEQRSIYAIAVNDRALEARLEQLLQALPDACDGAAGKALEGANLDRWLDELDQLMARNGERVAWSARRIP
jgi:hypothetical protein